jgi:hypothetical protein
MYNIIVIKMGGFSVNWRNSKAYGEVRSLVDDVKIVDTHEHLPPEGERIRVGGEALKGLFHISGSRLAIPNGAIRALKIAARDLYNINLFSENAQENLYKKVFEKNRKGLYRWVLREIGGIDLALTIDWPADCLEEAKGSILAPVLDIDFYILLHNRTSIDILSSRCNMPIHTLSDLSIALDAEINKHAPHIVAFKSAAAYTRTLKFDKVDYSEAEKTFNKISSRSLSEFPEPYLPSEPSISESLDHKEAEPLQDYLMHRII